VHGNLFSSGEKTSVAYIGGVFKSAPLLAECRNLVRDRLGCDLERPRLSPAAGALLEALRADGNGSALGNVPESEK
jgi:hypothetical protein